MQYNEIYNICQPVIDWLKEHYPHNHKIVIETTGANLIEDGKLVVPDKDLKSHLLKKPFMTKTSEKETNVHRLNMDMLKNLFEYQNQSEPKKVNGEEPE